MDKDSKKSRVIVSADHCISSSTTSSIKGIGGVHQLPPVFLTSVSQPSLPYDDLRETNVATAIAVEAAKRALVRSIMLSPSWIPYSQSQFEVELVKRQLEFKDIQRHMAANALDLAARLTGRTGVVSMPRRLSRHANAE